MLSLLASFFIKYIQYVIAICHVNTFNMSHGLSDFFQLGFTPCKAEQPLQCMELKEKEVQKCLERTYMLLLDFKPFRS